MAAAAFEKRGPLKREDVTCPICWSVLIEPVTLPCKHNLCLECFRKHVNETALVCPCCRKRFSVWSRRACKENNLVNVSYWERIQREFPKLVEARLNNEDSQTLDQSDLISTEDEIFVNGDSSTLLDSMLPSPPPKRDGETAKKGEIMQEYNSLYQKHIEDMENQRKLEADASSEFIRKLQEEELIRAAEDSSKFEADLELAKRIQMEENARVQTLAINKRQSESKTTPTKKPLCRNLLSEWGSASTSAVISPVTKRKSSGQLSTGWQTPTSSTSLKRRSSTTSIRSGKSSKSSKSGKEVGKTVGSQSSILHFFSNSQPTDSFTPSPQPSTSAAAIAEMNLSKTLPSSSFVVVCNTNNVTLSGSNVKLESQDKAGFISPKSKEEKHSPMKSLNQSQQPTVTFAEQPVVTNDKGTPDSIHVELNSYFRPIRSAPKTPPKRLADGTYLPEPKIVRTTPIRPSPKVTNSAIPIQMRAYIDKSSDTDSDFDTPSKTSGIYCSGSSESDFLVYPGLQQTPTQNIVKKTAEQSNSGDNLIDTIESSHNSGEAMFTPGKKVKLKTIIECDNGDKPDSPILPSYEEQEIHFELEERFRRQKEQELADYLFAKKLEKELNRMPGVEPRSRESKERYSIRNWLKPKEELHSVQSNSDDTLVNKSASRGKQRENSKLTNKKQKTPKKSIKLTKKSSTPKRVQGLKAVHVNIAVTSNISATNSPLKSDNSFSCTKRELRSSSGF